MKGRQPCIHGNLCRAIYNLTGCIYSVRCPYECEFYEPVKKVTSEWIPVSERFPKNISTGIVQVKEIEKPTFGWYGSINGWRLSDKDYKGLTRFSVIAWMPLPEPYKEQNDDI